jgi:hypothetical protein
MSLNDRLKQAVDKVDPDRRVAELKASAGELAREHGGKVEEVLGKVEAKVDTRTKGKYADKLATAHRRVTEGVARVAAQPPLDDVRPPRQEPYGERPPGELPPRD